MLDDNEKSDIENADDILLDKLLDETRANMHSFGEIKDTSLAWYDEEKETLDPLVNRVKNMIVRENEKPEEDEGEINLQELLNKNRSEMVSYGMIRGTTYDEEKESLEPLARRVNQLISGKKNADDAHETKMNEILK